MAGMEKTKKANKKLKKSKDKEPKKRKKRQRRSNTNVINDNDSSQDSGKMMSPKKGSNDRIPMNSDCFTPPPPPSQFYALRSNSIAANKAASDSDESPKPEKVKSRWRRSSELESSHHSDVSNHVNSATERNPLGSINSPSSTGNQINSQPIISPAETEKPPPFEAIEENEYLFERKKCKIKKEVKRMVCDCILTKEDRVRGITGCGDDCLNRMLMIECGSRCPLGDHCANKRFQKKQYVKVEPFRTARKGWGVRALQVLHAGSFIIEYVGEVLDPVKFKARAKRYAKEKQIHHYFMALRSDEIIDATEKGNIARFANHSCDPNCETQKWTVNGELRIGFFCKREVAPGEELTLDYQFQRYGKEAQRCFCETENCRGFIGANDISIHLNESPILPKQRIKNLENEDKFKVDEFEDFALEDEVEKLVQSGGLRNRLQTLMLARLMVRAEDNISRHKLVKVMKETFEVAYLRLLLDYHGLQLLWSWMTEVEDVYLKAEIIELLQILPIPNITMLRDSKVLAIVERWSKEEEKRNISTDVLSVAVLPEVKDICALNESPADVSEITEEVSTEGKVSENEMIVNFEGTNDAEECEKEDESQKLQSNDERVVNEITEECKSNDSRQDIKLECENTDNLIVESKEAATEVESQVVSEKVEEVFKKEPIDDNVDSSTTEVEMETEKESEVVSLNLGENEGVKLPDEQKLPELTNEKADMDLELENEPNIESSSENNKEMLTNDLGATESAVKIKPILPTLESIKPLETGQPTPCISSLALRLLNQWKDLKEVFRIPRLERQKRQEDEKEADRKAIELEQRKARGLPLIYERNKRGQDERDYTIAGILGLRKKIVKKPVDEYKRVQDFNSNNQISSQEDASHVNNHVNNHCNAQNNLVPIAPKITKEERRMQFAIEVMQKDYEEAMKKYQQQMEYYQQLYQQSISSHHDPRMNAVNYPNTFDQTYYGNNFNNAGNCDTDQYMSESYVGYPTAPIQPDGFYNGTQTTSLHDFNPAGESFEDPNGGDEIFNIMNKENKPTLILLTDPSLSEPMSDEKATIEMDHCSNYIDNIVDLEESEGDIRNTSERKSDSSFFDMVYPPPGVFYETENEMTYFVPSQVDSRNQLVEKLVFNDVPLPYSTNYFNNVKLLEAPKNWIVLSDKNGNKFYYNQITDDCCWNEPEVVEEDDVCLHESEVNQVEEKSDIDFKDEMMPESSLSNENSSTNTTASSTPNICSSSRLSNSNDAPNVDPMDETAAEPTPPMASYFADEIPYEADPRKRKYLNYTPSSSMPNNTPEFVSYAASDTQTFPIVNNSHQAHLNRESSADRRLKERFKAEMSEHIKHCLNPFRRPDCKLGRILSNDDFKFLARKLTHFVMVKELKQCNHQADKLSCTEAVKHKAKDFVRKYMVKQGRTYRADQSEDKSLSPREASQDSLND